MTAQGTVSVPMIPHDQARQEAALYRLSIALALTMAAEIAAEFAAAEKLEELEDALEAIAVGLTLGEEAGRAFLLELSLRLGRVKIVPMP